MKRFEWLVHLLPAIITSVIAVLIISCVPNNVNTTELTPINNPDFKCSSEVEVYGEMVQNTNEYMVIVNRETILPISTRYEITTYYVYKDLSIVCYKQEYTTEVELYASN